MAMGWGLGLDLDRHKRPPSSPVSTQAEFARQILEERLAAIIEDGEGVYRYFLQRETPRCKRYPNNPLTWGLIGIELGPRAEFWTEQNVGLPYRWEDEDPRHPDGRVCLEGTQAGEGHCQAWPTKCVQQAIRDGWLLYSGLVVSQRQPVIVEQGGNALTASLERQFIANTRMEIFHAWQVKEVRRRGSWLNVPTGASIFGPPFWDNALEAELQRRLQEYRRHPGHLW